MHAVLERQLKKVFGDIGRVPKELDPLIVLVSATYEHADEDRRMKEHSLEVSSRELGGLNEQLQKESASLKERTEEAEQSRRAVLNLLEDLEEEKKKVEDLVTVRTKELADEKARLLASINSLSFGFIIVDLEHRILLKNRAMMELFELKAGDEINVDEISKRIGVSNDFIRMNAEACFRSKKLCDLKDIVFGKKFLRGIVAPVALRGSAEGPDDVIGYVLLLEDITEAKVMERSRDEFFSIASHELRTPLTAIRGNADMILDMYSDKITDKDMKDMLVDINSSSVRLIAIVNDFLEVSRLEQGKIEIKKEDANLVPLVEKVLKILTANKKQGVTLVFTPPTAPLPNVHTDPARVEEILVNLIGNSMKFTSEGSITVSVEMIPGFVKVLVTDTGIGISAKNQTLLFRKFQQAGEDTIARDVTQGTGLGLYICRLVISALGGTIGLEKSEMGKGSTFAFTVPIAS